MLLGCIADDFTGATDLANTLVRQGMTTAVLPGVPRGNLPAPDTDAVVVALKSRSNPAAEAVRQSLDAAAWLERAGARQFFFKYCSTFDSTDAGNIGPVADALLAAFGEAFTIACPAFPTNHRTVYKGNLFVGDVPLSESGMRHHPLTPMTDSNLVRVLQRQTKGTVGLVQHATVDRGADAIRDALGALRTTGCRFAIVDALTDAHLAAIGTACANMKLITGGSGIALGLPQNYRRAGLLAVRAAAALPDVNGHAAVLAGSCSAATQKQVAAMKARCEWHEIDPLALAAGDDGVRHALDWARPRLGARPVLIYSTADAAGIEKVQAALGRERAGSLIEQAMGAIARQLVQMGVARLVVAGGETAGAVVTALGVEGLLIGPEIDPGVPWTTSLGAKPVALALKSGNFGGEDFFARAFAALPVAG